MLGHYNDRDSSALRTRTTTVMLERVKGTFLWVGFAMLELLKQKTWTDVEAIMKLLPKGLPALYDRMLLQIDPHHRQRSSCLLRWVTLAARPLTLAELGAALDLLPSANADSDQAIRDQVTVCGPFVRITNERVALVHESAREYLLRIDTTAIAALEHFHIQSTAAHLEMAHICVASIERCFERGSLGRSLSKGTLSPHYAIRYWPEHARRASSCAAKLVQREMSFFAHGSTVRHQWFARYWSYKTGNSLIFYKISDLHTACLLGIIPWAQKLLGTPSATLIRVHRSNSLAQGPLLLAVLGGHIEMVRFIL